MALGIGSEGVDDDELMSAINTTPLVDVMLVLLIVFLIAIPVAIETVPVRLPRASNVVTQTKPENVILAVDRDGSVFWNSEKMTDRDMLLRRLGEVAARKPQPEIHVRGDRDTRFEFMGRIMAACARAGIGKVAFITAPEPGAGEEAR